MNKTKILVKVIAAVLLCSGWRPQPGATITMAHWLVGTWQNKTQKGSVYETWTPGGEDRLIGKSYILKGTDTLLLERMELLQKGDSLFYIPRVINQNGGLPVRFEGLFITPQQLVFENKAHDFPQRISYTRLGPDSLLAAISGLKQGQQRRQEFRMRRVK